jgi:serine/threonine-protein kinase
MTVSLPLHIQQHVGKIADGYIEGRTPDIELALQGLDAAFCGEFAELAELDLFQELLETELRRLTADGQRPELAGYAAQFPKRHEEIVRIFGELNRQPQGELVSGDSLGRYLLLKLVGRGGMGQVWQARHKLSGQIVALKVAGDAQAQESQAVRAFLSEIRTMAKVQHDNLVELRDAGDECGRTYLAMRYIDGYSLQEHIGIQTPTIEPLLGAAAGAPATPDPARKDKPRLAPAEAARFLRDAARGTAHLHQFGIVHRDLKPGNIMLEELEDHGQRVWRARVADFGLAKAADSPTWTRAGTASYMAPEQAADPEQATVLSDVYSLGATLYALLTGRPPHQKASVAEPDTEFLARVQAEAPVPPRELVIGVSPDLEAICLKCLAQEPQLRYRSADDLADDLERYLRTEPVVARPINPAERWWRLCRGIALLCIAV